MDVVIDIGNTRTKVAAFQFGKLLMQRDVIAEIDDDLVQSIELLQPKRGIVSTVAGDAGRWLKAFPQVNWLQFNHGTPLPFTNGYATPHTLGLDRIALVAAANQEFKQKNVLVVDAGTCVTYDVLQADGTYVGGAIAPGLRMRLAAMHHFTAKLPLADADSHAKLLGSSTQTCLQAGALHGLAAEVDGLINRYAEQFDNLQTVVTGGDLPTLAPLLKNNIFARPNFLLEGLHVILAFNTP